MNFALKAMCFVLLWTVYANGQDNAEKIKVNFLYSQDLITEGFYESTADIEAKARIAVDNCTRTLRNSNIRNPNGGYQEFVYNGLYEATYEINLMESAFSGLDTYHFPDEIQPANVPDKVTVTIYSLMRRGGVLGTANTNGYKIAMRAGYLTNWAFVHEMGHTLGAAHANGYNCVDPNTGKIHQTSMNSGYLPFYSDPTRRYCGNRLGTFDFDGDSCLPVRSGILGRFVGLGFVPIGPVLDSSYVRTPVTNMITHRFWARPNATKLVVSISGENSGDGTPVVTYAGRSLVQAVEGSGRSLGIWYLDNPPTSGDASVVVDLSSYSSVGGIGMGVISLRDTEPGVDTVATAAANHVSIASSAENSIVVVGYAAEGDGTDLSKFRADNPLTELYLGDIGSAQGGAAYSLLRDTEEHDYSFTSANGTDPVMTAAVFNFTTDINLPPRFVVDPVITEVARSDQPYSSSLVRYAEDHENDPLTFRKLAGPAWLSVAADGTMSGTPTADNQGLNYFTIRVEDAKSCTDALLLVSVDFADAWVPNVVGKLQAVAESDITDLDLKVGTVTEQYHPDITAGTVISQNPATGIKARLGTQIDLEVSAGPAPAGTAIYTGANARFQNDTWNINNNWNYDNGSVPAGAVDVIIAPRKIVQVNSAATPIYTGTLSIGGNSKLTIYANPEDIHALGSGEIAMAAGSYLTFRGPRTYVLTQPIILQGDATITASSSTAQSVDLTLSQSVSGNHTLSVTGNIRSKVRLAAANNVPKFVAASGGYTPNVQVFADVVGSLGTGDVVVSDTVSLTINEADIIADNATLTLIGVGSSVGEGKLVMNANDTVNALVIDGVPQPAGVYDSTQPWLVGTGLLTVSTQDLLAPSIIQLNPLDGAADVPADSTLSIVFNEDIVLGSGYITLCESGTDLALESYNVGLNLPNLTIDGDTLTISPFSDLRASTGYYVQIEPTTIRDKFGNSFAGITDKTTWSFATTGTSNLPPVIISAATASPAALTLGDETTLSVAAGDPDGDALSYSWSKVSGPGTVTFTAVSAASTAAQFSEVGSYVLMVTVSDGSLSTTSDVTVIVEAPVEISLPTVEITSPLEGAQFLTTEDVVVSVLASDNNGIDHVRLKLDGVDVDPVGITEPYEWNLGTLAAGTHELRILAFANDIDPDTGTNEWSYDVVNIEITEPVNSAPVIVSEAVAEPGTIGLLESTTLSVVATDPDGDELSYSWSNASGPGMVTFGNDSSATTTAQFSEVGSYVLMVTVSDGSLSATSEVTVIVEAPVEISLPTVAITSPLEGAQFSTSEDVVVAVQASDNSGIYRVRLKLDDVNIDPIGIDEPYEWNLGRLAVGSHELRVLAFANDIDPDTGTNEWSYDVVTIEITEPVNSAPVIVSEALAVPSTVDLTDAITELSVVAEDPDGDTLTYSWSRISGPGTVTFTSNGTAGSDVTVAEFSAAGTYELEVVATDGTLQASSSVAVTVVDNTVTEPPVAYSQSLIVRWGRELPITLTGGPAGADLTFEIVSMPGGGTLTGTAPSVTYKSVKGFKGLDSFTFKVNDGTQDSNVATITINVTNQKPTGKNQTLQVETTPSIQAAPMDSSGAMQSLGTPFTLKGTDVDGDELTFRIQSLPLNGTVSGTVPNLSYIPKAGFIGNDQLTYIINDGLEDSEPVAVEMMVASEKTTSGSTEASDDSSGGCSTGEGSSGSAWLIVLLVAGLCLQRKGITPQAEESQ